MTPVKEEPHNNTSCASKRTRGRWIAWRRLFACFGRHQENPGQVECEKNEVGNQSEGAKQELVVEKELRKDVTFNRMLLTISENSGTIYNNPPSEEFCELDSIDDPYFVPVYDSSSIVKVQGIDARSWHKKPVLETGDEPSHRSSHSSSEGAQPERQLLRTDEHAYSNGRTCMTTCAAPPCQRNHQSLQSQQRR